MNNSNKTPPPFELIDGYSYRYLVTRDGVVFDFVKGRVLTRTISSSGYLTVSLQDESGEKKNILLHRIVATAFCPNPSSYPCVNHKNGDKLDNRAENLEWCSYHDNNVHAYNMGLSERRKRRKIKYSVYCVETKELFSSIRECSYAHNIKYDTLRAHLQGRDKTCFGKHYEKRLKRGAKAPSNKTSKD